MSQVDGKRIIIGVTGGIAAYKVAGLVSTLSQLGVQVQVLMTAAAQRFVAPLTFQSLSGHPVIQEEWDTASLPQISNSASAWHIAVSEWADLFLIAPASADCIAKLAHGMTNDPVSLVASAMPRNEQGNLIQPILFAPAMNTNMWRNPANQQNVDYLIESMGYEMIKPGEGWQACRNHGEGRLSEPEEILQRIEKIFYDLA